MFCSIQAVSTFSVKFNWRSLTDEQILEVLRVLFGDDSGNIETKSDNDNHEDCVSFWRQEISKWTVRSLCQSWSSTGRQWPQQSYWNFSKECFSCKKMLLEKHYIVIANCIFNIYLFYQSTQDGKTYKKTCMGHFHPLHRTRKFKISAVPVLI